MGAHPMYGTRDRFRPGAGDIDDETIREQRQHLTEEPLESPGIRPPGPGAEDRDVALRRSRRRGLRERGQVEVLRALARPQTGERPRVLVRQRPYRARAAAELL